MDKVLNDLTGLLLKSFSYPEATMYENISLIRLINKLIN